MKQIHWYPGHMAKTKKEIIEKVKFIDVVLEILDARIPFSSQNPVIKGMIGNTPKIILFNKSDLTDSHELEKWVAYFENMGVPSLRINAITGQGFDKLLPLMKKLLAEKIAKEKSRGRTERPIRAMILGIPNVGKSTVINKLAKKGKLITADRPGVTKQTQYIRVGKDFELLDTPGILWPKFNDEKIAIKLALTGAIKDDILPRDDVVIYGFQVLDKYYKGRLEEKYNVKVDLENIAQLFDDIGIRRGCLLPGKQIDYERVMDLFLNEFRQGKLGKVALDRVNELV